MSEESTLLTKIDELNSRLDAQERYPGISCSKPQDQSCVNMTISLYCYISEFLHSYTVLSLFESSLYMYIDSCMLPGSSVVPYLLASQLRVYPP